MVGKGRAPCCDKTKVKRGPWSPSEDSTLITFIQKHGHSNWRALPKQAGLLRCGKSCRLRWINYLRPDVKRGSFTPQEDETIINLHNSFGNKWSKIASALPGRTDNEIKNHWNTHLKKRLKNKSTTNQCGDNNKLEAKDSEPNNSIPASPSCTSSSMTSSSVDQNPEKALDVGQDIQEPEPQKPSSDNSAQSSYASNFPCPNDTTLEFSKSVVVNNINEGAEDAKIEIPLESDIDFWELFDSLDKNQKYSNNNIKPEEKIEDGVDCSKWFRLLENELGLTCDEDKLDQNNVPTTLEPETGPGLDYFPMWPNSPQNQSWHLDLLELC